MKQVKLERAGLTVSNMCLGTMLYGTKTEEAEAFRQMDLFVDMGGNFLDTSNNYAHWMPGATGDESETLLGKWLSDRGCRDQLVIATKVGFDRHGIGAGLSAKQIEYWCDESLRKLGTDYIDLYYAHTDDMNTPIEETLEAFDRLIQKGKVRAIGASNYYPWRLAEAKEIAKEKAIADYTVNQSCYTYLYTKTGYKNPYAFNLNLSDGDLHYLAKNNVPLVPYSCLASGGYDHPERLPDKYIQDERLQVLWNTAKELGLTPSELVLAWLLGSDRLPNRPKIVPLFSASTTAHLEQSLKMADYVLDEEILKKLTYANF